MPKQVHARFRLERVDRMQVGYKAPGEETAKTVMGAYVTLRAVQGEPFGNYTPNGSMQMGIHNPTAAQVFLDARIGQEFDILISPVESEQTQ